jgi:dTDP-4-dehydrorhamnose 3,5-epimerase
MASDLQHEAGVELESEDLIEVRPEVAQDLPTVDDRGRPLTTGIDGVQLHRLGPRHVDHRGSLMEVVDVRLPFWSEPIVYAYHITVAPGRIKGWGMHKLQADRYYIASGFLRVVLHDGRPDSPTYRQFKQFYFGDETPSLLRIPPGVWHADQNLGEKDVLIINYPTRIYDKRNPDKYRIDVRSDLIPFDWDLGDSMPLR